MTVTTSTNSPRSDAARCDAVHDSGTRPGREEAACMARRVRPRLDREVLRLRQVALDAAAAGLFVFPVKAGSKIPAFHGETRCRGRGFCLGRRRWFR